MGHSGMQKQVLSLYRGFLRVARSKGLEERSQIESIVSAEFRRNAELIDRKSFIYIEYLLRRAQKQLDQLKSPDTVGLSSLKVPQGKYEHGANEKTSAISICDTLAFGDEQRWLEMMSQNDLV
ncbi:hypothetical protein HHK36_023969 [Tetracentron sinense]|uniref:Complex 1 LYR protein domain-containing protein n=1 Tax=Tetracentron sinense TaxID=13715 RepID=A0A834YNN6_TETSI|nr:hypothetical protein HHK36_023969 [Tetracentron sinense]